MRIYIQAMARQHARTMTRPITTGMSVNLYHVVGDGSSKLPVHGCLHRSLSGGNPENPSIHTPRSRQTDATTPNALRKRGFGCVSTDRPATVLVQTGASTPNALRKRGFGCVSRDRQTGS